MKFLIPLLLCAAPLAAEEARYGDVDLTGLTRDNGWLYNAPGIEYVMVCNVNGPDGFLTVRSGPSADTPSRRNFNRLAILTIDSRARQGHWVKVLDGHRSHSAQGDRLAQVKDLPVSGWAHDGYLCDFLD